MQDVETIVEEFEKPTPPAAKGEKGEKADFPAPPASSSIMPVGNTCAQCGIEQGLFPRSQYCQYCRPRQQLNGRVIRAITWQPSGSTTETRLPTDALRVGADSKVSFRHSDHKAGAWLNGPPACSTEEDVFTFLVPDHESRPTLYHIYFGEESLTDD